jgi:hypothetical protein
MEISMFETAQTLYGNFPKWYAAAQIRHSCRSYRDTALDTAERAKITGTAELLNGALPGVRIAVIFGAETAKRVFAMVGGYGTIKNPPAVAAFIADKNDEAAYEKAGFLGEAFVLEMTAAGFATCWVSGTYSRASMERLISLKENEQLVAVTPVGFAAQKKGMMERFTRFYSRGAQRKPLDTICKDFESLPGWAKKCVECARIAPSAVNSQPWRFRFENGLLLETPQKSSLTQPKLDLGICMLHVVIAAGVQGVNGRWEKTAFHYLFK